MRLATLNHVQLLQVTSDAPFTTAASLPHNAACSWTCIVLMLAYRIGMQVLRVCWMPDTAEASALVSGGADGQVRIWHKRTITAALSKQSPLKQAAAAGPVIKCTAKLDHTGE